MSKQVSHVILPLRNLTSDWLILTWRVSGGKTLHGVVSCVLLCTVNSIYVSVLCLSCLVCLMYNLVKKCLDSDIGGNNLIPTRKNGMLLQVDRTEALTI